LEFSAQISRLGERNANMPDVLRGEETQLAGMASLIGTGSHLVCMLGTHSKWVIAEGGAISGFGTWPTGEMFSVLSQHSILRHSIGDIGARLFGIRAAGRLNGLSQDDAAAALSGLLSSSCPGRWANSMPRQCASTASR